MNPVSKSFQFFTLMAFLSGVTLGTIFSKPALTETLRDCIVRYQANYGISADEAIRQCRLDGVEPPSLRQIDQPIITSISPIVSNPNQQIIIRGRGFGQLRPYNGNSAYIRISDTTDNWNAGSTRDSPPDYVTLNITSWTDTEIIVSGFTGSYGSRNWTLDNGDVIAVQIWNAQSGKGPSVCSRIVNDQTRKLCAYPNSELIKISQ